MAGPAVRRCRHRDPESLGQRDELARRAGPADPAAGHDHRPVRGLEQGQGGAHGLVVRSRPERRYRRELGLDDVIEHSCLRVELPLVPLNLQVNRSRRAGRRRPERVPQHVGQPGDVVYRAVELGDLVERGQVVCLLVDLPELRLGEPAAGERHHRRPGEERLAQASRQVEGADSLRAADARPAARARVTVGHVDGRLLTVRGDRGDLRVQALQLGEGPAHDGGHHEQVRDAVAVQHLGDRGRALLLNSVRGAHQAAPSRRSSVVHAVKAGPTYDHHTMKERNWPHAVASWNPGAGLRT